MTKKEQKIIVLLDAHAILHRAFHALPPLTSPKGEPTGALYGFSSMLIKIIGELKPDYIAACYDLPKPTFRHIAYEGYKAKRAKMDDELVPQIEKSREILKVFGIPVYDAPGFEADDIIGTITEQVKNKKNLKTVIASGDMDALQLVSGDDVVVYTLKKGIKDTIIYNESAVKERLGFMPELLPDFKGIKGDPSDNIIGVPGIGDKGATELIQKFGTIEEIYKALEKNEAAFEKAGIKKRTVELLKKHKEDALFSKELATIRTDAPIKFALEDAEYKNGRDNKKIEQLFRELGFASLLARLPTTASPGVQRLGSKEGLRKLQIAAWLMDSRMNNPSLEDILNFADADNAADAEQKLRARLKEENLEKFYQETELPLVDVLKEMQKTGALIDKSALENLSRETAARISDLERKIWRMAGMEFNIASPKQLSEVLFQKMGVRTKGIKKTKTGSYSTGADILHKLRAEHEIIDLILQYRELSKIKNTYIDVLPALADENSRIHTSYSQTGTSTGRLSSQDPNLQNIPVKTELGREVRRAFVAPKGWALLAADYSQIELRIAAILSDDKAMKEAFLSGRDIHTATASAVFNVPEDKVTSRMRRQAKVINFGILYGMGSRALAQNMEVPQEEAQKFLEEYFHDFAGVKKYIEQTEREAIKNGFIKTLFGRKRHFPELQRRLPEYMQKEFLRMAVNAPIQGTASDVMKIAMVRVDNALKKNKTLANGARMILQIHDELLFEIKESVLEEAAGIIKKEMESVRLDEVPLIADISSGPNWAEMKKINQL